MSQPTPTHTQGDSQSVIALVRAVDDILQDHYHGHWRLNPLHKVRLIDALADLPPHIRDAGLHR